jgi:hypothetical protein
MGICRQALDVLKNALLSQSVNCSLSFKNVKAADDCIGALKNVLGSDLVLSKFIMSYGVQVVLYNLSLVQAAEVESITESLGGTYYHNYKFSPENREES